MAETGTVVWSFVVTAIVLGYSIVSLAKIGEDWDKWHCGAPIQVWWVLQVAALVSLRMVHSTASVIELMDDEDDDDEDDSFPMMFPVFSDNPCLVALSAMGLLCSCSLVLCTLLGMGVMTVYILEFDSQHDCWPDDDVNEPIFFTVVLIFSIFWSAVYVAFWVSVFSGRLERPQEPEEIVLRIPLQEVLQDLPTRPTTEDDPWCWQPCCICHEDIFVGTIVRVSRCNHAFHPACIERWFRVGRPPANLTCPQCRDHVSDAVENALATGEWRGPAAPEASGSASPQAREMNSVVIQTR